MHKAAEHFACLTPCTFESYAHPGLLTHAMTPRLGGEFRDFGRCFVEVLQGHQAGSGNRGRRLEKLGSLGQQTVPHVTCGAWACWVKWEKGMDRQQELLFWMANEKKKVLPPPFHPPQLACLGENIDALLPTAGVGVLLPILQNQPLHQVLGEVIPLGLLEGSHACGVSGGAILLVLDQG